MDLALGLDTGGTFTDGVLLNLADQKVIKKAKALTTYEQLAFGIKACIENLGLEESERIKLVALSTTLATNAIVEGRGCEVGLILIGSEPLAGLPVHHYEVIAGGHDINGKPLRDLDHQAVRQAVMSFKGKVDAIAVSSYLSVRNPEHELCVRDIVQETLGVPVVCGHQLTSSLGFQERTVTAALNAKLIPVITDLINAVKQVLLEFNIKAELMVVKGDGTLMSEKMALQKPIDTILSGPAASIVGALALTNKENAMVLDMGGTTSDIAILRDGVPQVNKQGATVGGWLTRVEAANIYTYGLGGDSYIQVPDRGTLQVGPKRVWPLAVAVARYPYLIEELQQVLEGSQQFSLAQPTDCFILLKEHTVAELNKIEAAAVEVLRAGAHTLMKLAELMGTDPYFVNLQRLIELGIVAKASVTPTDLLHASGYYTPWRVDASKLGIEILSIRFGTSAQEFLEQAMEQVVDSLCLTVMESLLSYEEAPVGLLKDQVFLKKLLQPSSSQPLGFSAQVKLPLIATGAPVSAFLPRVAEKLKCELVIPKHAEVANAIGAASGRVMERLEALIKPGQAGGYTLHLPWERSEFTELEEAKAYAEAQLHKEIALIAASAGAADCKILLDIKDVYVLGEVGRSQGIFMETVLNATAMGRPKWS